MYLSFSGFKTFKDCPEQYNLEYPPEDAVVQPIPPPDRVGMLYGQTVGRLVETFYKDKVWRQKDPKAYLIGLAAPTLVAVMKEEREEGGTFLWKKNDHYKKPEDVLADVVASVPRVLGTIKEHKFLGGNAEAELKLDSIIDGNKIAGRADIVLTRIGHEDLVILDGKGSRYREQYADVRQLYWYAMLYEVKFGRLPDKVAFVFWRSDPKEAVDWHPVTREAIDNLKAEITQVIRAIEIFQHRKVFLYRAKSSRCRLCDYNSVCPAGQIMNSKGGLELEGVDGDVSLGLKEEF